MVLYCCVNGCGNNSKKAKKDPDSEISFHSFPSNQELKTKWLRAIGRPNWTPANYSRVCSAHFNYEQINHEGYRKRIQEEAVPVNLLPPNSNFEASDVEACRICLATDVKIYSLRDTHLGTCMESLAGVFSENGMNFEDMPHYVCYQCVPDLIKCNKVIEKCMISQATLLDIFVINGQITKRLIKEQNTKIPLVKSSLKDYMHHDEDSNTSQFTATDSNENDDIYVKKSYTDRLKKNKCNVEALEFDDAYDDDDVEEIIIYTSHDDGENGDLNSDLSSNTQKDKTRNNLIKEENKYHLRLKTPVKNTYMDKYYDDIDASPATTLDSNDNEDIDFENDDMYEDSNLENNECKVDGLEVEFDEENDDVVEEIIIYTSPDADAENGDLNTDLSLNAQKKKESTSQVKKIYTKKNHRLPPDETNLLKYFNVIDLSPQEQIQEWKKRTAAHSLTSETIYQCAICNRTFANLKSYRFHVSNHEPSFGRAQCPICKLRFKTTAQATLHSKRVHSRKYFCKTCPKTYNNVDVARKHHRWHLDRSLAHSCSLCGLAYSSRGELETHRLTAHLRSVKDKVITKKYRCETCEIDFASESARQVHLLTSNKHRKKPKLWARETAIQDANLSKSCIICGIKCSSYKELALHMKAEHSRPQAKNLPWRGDAPYPRDCELCGVTLTTRKKHWLHIRWKHPKNVDSYKAVIKTICDICGKGCQSLTKLRLHQLRHRNPTVRCDRCPRVFYDKFGLARHAPMHDNDKPHQCSTCGRAFKLLNNLKRHYKVHTDIAPYECSICGNKFKYSTSVNLHVRTVHYKIPQPIRKKRNKSLKNASDS